MIQGDKQALKGLSRRCMVCQAAYSRTNNQVMGILPPERTSLAPPFHHCGLDFAGPFSTHTGRMRKPTVLKSYAAVFICMSTKAMEFLPYSDLNTESFLICLRRFCIQRGTPAELFLDNGTNFLRARKELQQIGLIINSPKTSQAMAHFNDQHSMKWKLVTPRAPHQGDLWESAVKVMMLVLKKLQIPKLLSYDEFATLLTEAAAILISRALLPCYSLEPEKGGVTANHLMIGRPMRAPPPETVDT